MSDCRVVRKDLLFLIVLTIVSLVCGLSQAQMADALPLDDPNAVVEKVISALKSLELPARGRGTAVMLTENYREDLDNTELAVDFVFTEQTSRTDIFEARGGIAGSRLFARVVSDKSVVTVLPSGADIRKPRRHLDIGLDFQPEVFMQFQGIPLTKRLESTLRYAKQRIHLSIELDDKGILHIVWRGKIAINSPNELYNQEVRMSFDTNKGLLPVLLRSTTERPEGTSSSIVRLKWTKYNSAWYPSRAEYVLQPDNRFHRTIVVESFTPDVRDEEFVLDWLDVPDGLNVSGAGKMRWYKSPFHPADDPEIPLDEIDFVQEIRKQQSSVASKANADDADKAAGGFYLRDYQSGRLIGPLSSRPGSLLPPLDRKTYVVADPAESELATRKLLLEAKLYESHHFDNDVEEIIGTIQQMLKHRIGDKMPIFRVHDVHVPISMKIGAEEPAYEVLFRIAAKAKARVLIEDGAVVLSRKKLAELANLDATTSETVARRERPSR